MPSNRHRQCQKQLVLVAGFAVEGLISTVEEEFPVALEYSAAAASSRVLP